MMLQSMSMPNYDELKWSITPLLGPWNDEDSDGNATYLGDVCYAEVRPIVNGLLLDTPWMFDTLEVMFHAREGLHALDMFTCSCGIAGCAGIHNHMFIRVEPTMVYWQFPREEPFLRNFVPKHFAVLDKRLAWCFERKAYANAIASLKKQLQNLEEVHKHVALWPQPDYMVSLPPKIANVLLQRKKQFDEFVRNEMRERAIWGTFYDGLVEITVSEETVELSPQQIIFVLGEHLFFEDFEDTEKQKIWEQEQIQQLAMDPGKLIELIKMAPWSTWENEVHFKKEELKEIAENQWPNVRMVFKEHSKNNIDWDIF